MEAKFKLVNSKRLLELTLTVISEDSVIFNIHIISTSNLEQPRLSYEFTYFGLCYYN